MFAVIAQILVKPRSNPELAQTAGAVPPPPGNGVVTIGELDYDKNKQSVAGQQAAAPL
jgi:hypothetical protein